MAFSIMPIIFMVLLRPVRDLGMHGALKKLGSKLLKPEKVLIENFLFSAFVPLEEKLMTPRTANIYLLNPERKVGSGFSFCNNGLLDGLFLDVFPMANLFSLSTDKRP